MADIKLVKFTRPQGKYNAGEQAGFPEWQANHFVRHGVAVFVDPPPPVEEAPDDKVVVTVAEHVEEEAPAAEVVEEPEAEAEEEDNEDIVHRGRGDWYVINTDTGEDISGPHKKRELREMGWDV